MREGGSENGRLVISWDVDDVMLDFIGSFRFYLYQHHREFFERHNLTLDRDEFRARWTGYGMAKVFGVTEEEEIEMIQGYYRSDMFLDMDVLPGAVEVVMQVNERGFISIANTVRPSWLSRETIAQLKRYFPEATFQGVYFSAGSLSSNQKRTKGEICRDIGARIHIDDALHNAQSCLPHGIVPIVLDSPWNANEREDYSGVRRYAADHQQILNHILEVCPNGELQTQTSRPSQKPFP